MKVATIIGARPQFIKAATVSRAFRENHPGVNEVLIHTGQHYDANMSEVFFDELDIPKPDYNLGIGGGTHGQNTGRMIELIEAVLMKEGPDWVLVYGDTDSTLAGTLAAVKLHIPVTHVEAGLRSFNKRMPEETNRKLTDHAADLLFTPTNVATNNLLNEGVIKESIVQVGDVMYDASIYYGDHALRTSNILDTVGLGPKSYVLATLHRAENTDCRSRLSAILEGLASSLMPIVLPLHPRTRKQIEHYGLSLPKVVRAINPVGYVDMLMLEQKAALIATDSGGVQKEAYFYRVPCLTLRDETEWVELISHGINQLVGADASVIGHLISHMPVITNWPEGLYGDGNAANKIAEHILGRRL